MKCILWNIIAIEMSEELARGKLELGTFTFQFIMIVKRSCIDSGFYA